MTFFSDLGLAEPILRALETKGYNDPTPIQRQSIPALLEGRDLLGIAQTGTGKTAAFSLPSIHRLAANPKARMPASCRMLVLSPTRELAAQIAENIREYAKNVQLNVQCVFGGVPVGKQSRALVPGTDILVATPGRLLDLIDQRALTLRNVEIFVLDEADQMMDLGFINALKRVANMLPKERQSLFFSATMPKAIADLGKQFINNPVRVEVTPQASTAERVEQYAIFLNQAEKQALLTIKLRAGLADNSIDRALVFSRTKHGADRVVKHLVAAGVSAAAIHGNKSQGQRTAAIKDFRSGEVRVLVATDIAARGIDIPGVSHVFNYELPNVAEQYVHRIGRTARAGADGIAISFVAPDEKPYLRDIEKLTRISLDRLPLPEDFQKEASRLPLPSRAKLADPMQDRENRHRPQPRRNGPGAAPERRDPRHGMQDARPPRDREPREGGRDRTGPEGRPQPAVHSARPFNSRGDDNRQAPRGDQRQAPRGDQRPASGDNRQAPRADRQAPRADGARRPEGQRNDGPRHDGGQRRDGQRPSRPQGQQGQGGRRSPAGRSR